MSSAPQIVGYNARAEHSYIYLECWRHIGTARRTRRADSPYVFAVFERILHRDQLHRDSVWLVYVYAASVCVVADHYPRWRTHHIRCHDECVVGEVPPRTLRCLLHGLQHLAPGIDDYHVRHQCHIWRRDVRRKHRLSGWYAGIPGRECQRVVSNLGKCCACHSKSHGRRLDGAPF